MVTLGGWEWKFKVCSWFMLNATCYCKNIYIVQCHTHFMQWLDRCVEVRKEAGFEHISYFILHTTNRRTFLRITSIFSVVVGFNLCVKRQRCTYRSRCGWRAHPQMFNCTCWGYSNYKDTTWRTVIGCMDGLCFLLHDSDGDINSWKPNII